MANFFADTSVQGDKGRYVATLSPDWEVWGPNGGYMAAIAIRAMAAEASLSRPASFACHFLRSPTSAEVRIEVEHLRKGARAQSIRATMSQQDKPVLVSLMWVADKLEGVDHEAAGVPEAPSPDELEPWDAYMPGGEPPFPFFHNFDVRPAAPHPSRVGKEKMEPRVLVWMRLKETASEPRDPFLDAATFVAAADSMMYPAAAMPHGEFLPFVAPSLDLTMSFHGGSPGSDWLLIDASAPVSRMATVWGRVAVWSSEGHLLASGMQQMLQQTMAGTSVG